MAEETQFSPRIVLGFQNYKPPFDVEKVVRRMLRSVPAKYLWGLHAVVLTNAGALSRKERDRKTLSRRRGTQGEALGYYCKEWHGEPARATLLIDNLEKRWGRNWLRFGFTRDVLLSEVLFHELGHHIHHLHLPEYKEKENVAENWSEKLQVKYFRERYWYLMPLFIPISWIMRVVKKTTN